MDKTMEKEYKWRADEKLLGQALLWASSRIGSQSRTINMESSYFDTADGLLKEHQAALRLRRENDRSVCCMKLRNTDTPEKCKIKIGSDLLWIYTVSYNHGNNFTALFQYMAWR